MSEKKFVGRGGEKLIGAVQAFSFSFFGKRVLDIGSSTGGFTEVALRCGAKSVLAVEKGKGQMKAPLRYDSRIELREKTDFFDLKMEDLRGIQVILADVSFISLTKILESDIIKGCGKEVEFLVMLKPQFEAKREELVRGVVKNEKIRRKIMREFEFWLKDRGFLVVKKRDNETLGAKGNRERFYWLRRAA